MKRYLIFTKFMTPWYTDDPDKFDPDSHDIVFDLRDGEYTTNGIGWFKIEEDKP